MFDRFLIRIREKMGVMAEPENAQLINRKVPKKAKNATNASKPNVTMPKISMVLNGPIIFPLAFRRGAKNQQQSGSRRESDQD